MEGKKILLGVTGSSEAVKACALAKELSKGNEVRAVMTDTACMFVHPLSLLLATGHRPIKGKMKDCELHRSMKDLADILIVAPATANTLAKAANGFADNALTCFILASQCPVLYVPVMDPLIFSHITVQIDLDKLRSHGAHIFGTDEEGSGTMPSVRDIIDEAGSLVG